MCSTCVCHSVHGACVYAQSNLLASNTWYLCTALGVPAESSEQVDGGQRARAKSNPKTEVQKLFNRLKVGHHESVTQAKKRTPSDGGEGRPPSSSSPHLLSGTVSEGFLQMNLGLLRDLNAGKQLLDFCSSLPVFKILANEKRNFLSVPSGKGVTSGLAAVVGRYE